MKAKEKKKNGAVKEFFRKFMVSLKRRPQNIPLVALVISFLYYALNLTKISNTTAKIQGPHMGFCGFVTMLFSILVFVCFLNSFPKRQRPNYAMIALMYVMFAAIIFSDFYYRSRAIIATTRAENRIAVTELTHYIYEAESVTFIHAIMIIVVAVLIALLPVYGKLLKEVNTSIELDYSEGLGEIDISGED